MTGRNEDVPVLQSKLKKKTKKKSSSKKVINQNIQYTSANSDLSYGIEAPMLSSTTKKKKNKKKGKGSKLNNLSRKEDVDNPDDVDEEAREGKTSPPKQKQKKTNIQFRTNAF